MRTSLSWLIKWVHYVCAKWTVQTKTRMQRGVEHFNLTNKTQRKLKNQSISLRGELAGCNCSLQWKGKWLDDFPRTFQAYVSMIFGVGLIYLILFRASNSVCSNK